MAKKHHLNVACYSLLLIKKLLFSCPHYYKLWQSLLAYLPPPQFKKHSLLQGYIFRAVGPTPLLVCKADCL